MDLNTSQIGRPVSILNFAINNLTSKITPISFTHEHHQNLGGFFDFQNNNNNNK